MDNIVLYLLKLAFVAFGIIAILNIVVVGMLLVYLLYTILDPYNETKGRLAYWLRYLMWAVFIADCILLLSFIL